MPWNTGDFTYKHIRTLYKLLLGWVHNEYNFTHTQRPMPHVQLQNLAIQLRLWWWQHWYQLEPFTIPIITHIELIEPTVYQTNTWTGVCPYYVHEWKIIFGIYIDCQQSLSIGRCYYLVLFKSDPLMVLSTSYNPWEIYYWCASDVLGQRYLFKYAGFFCRAQLNPGAKGSTETVWHPFMFTRDAYRFLSKNGRFKFTSLTHVV